MATIVANGKPRDVPDGATIVDFLSQLGWKPEWVVVEHNGEPVERTLLGERLLRDGDRLEVVRAVAGGQLMDGAGLRARFAEARLYLVTDGHGGGEALREFLDVVLDAGVDIVQLREKELEARQILELARVVRERCGAYGVPFIINDRTDVALAARADGVHLGQDDLPLVEARRILGPDAIIGRSTHDVDQLRAAMAEDVDYVVAGPVHATPTKAGRPGTGLDLIRLAAAETTKPWFAIGGINQETIGAVRDAGARRVVVVRAITQASEPAAAVKELRAALS